MKNIILISSVLFLSSCKYGDTFNQIKSLKGLKQKVEVVSSQELTEDNQLKLKEYFSKIKDISYSYLNNPKMQRYTQRKFLRFFDENLCDEVLLDEVKYSKIMKKCTVSGFYICSEELKSYSAMLNRLKKSLTKSQLEKIVSNEQCKTKLSDLGVINE
ncbi:MAG: hypothetical protein N4A33_02865 [Bacteriovoracaceae bacterium]|jgi:F0F1-type ATP synthase delta subunit|nr:hypothetical protein [Bacteriovoracaceae bacterium]